MFKKLIGAVFILFVTAIIVLLIVDTIQINPKSITTRLIKSGNLKANELNLSLKYMKLIPLGTASLKNLGIEKYKGKDVYHLMAEANTLSFLSGIFKAKAKVDSFVDVKHMHSLVFLQHLEVSNKEDEDKEIIYDQNKNIMYFEGKQRVIFAHTQDPLSAIFYIQRENFTLGQNIKLYVNTNQKNYVLDATVIKRKEYLIDGKKAVIWLVKASIRRHDKSPRHSSELRIWFLEEKDNIPILIKVMTNVGFITAYLADLK